MNVWFCSALLLSDHLVCATCWAANCNVARDVTSCFHGDSAALLTPQARLFWPLSRPQQSRRDGRVRPESRGSSYTITRAHADTTCASSNRRRRRRRTHTNMQVYLSSHGRAPDAPFLLRADEEARAGIAALFSVRVISVRLQRGGLSPASRRRGNKPGRGRRVT